MRDHVVPTHMAERPNVYLTARNRPENLLLARQALRGFADAAGVEGVALADITTAVSEACTNVMLHAYDGAVGLLELELGLTSTQACRRLSRCRRRNPAARASTRRRARRRRPDGHSGSRARASSSSSSFPPLRHRGAPWSRLRTGLLDAPPATVAWPRRRRGSRRQPRTAMPLVSCCLAARRRTRPRTGAVRRGGPPRISQPTVSRTPKCSPRRSSGNARRCSTPSTCRRSWR